MEDTEEKRDAWLDRGVGGLTFVYGFMACVYTVVGIVAVNTAFFLTEVRAGKVETSYVPAAVYGALILAYAGLLAAASIGLSRRRPWGWWLGIGAAGLSLVLAILDAVRRAWGAAAFDLGFAVVAAACLLALRARACIRAQDR